MAKRNTYFQDEVIERKIDIKHLARIVRYAFPFKKYFITVAFLMVLASLLAMVTPLLLKQIIPDSLYSSVRRIIAGGSSKFYL